MKALLLAAGLGTRLAPITEVLPKCLVPILGRPILDYWLSIVHGMGIRKVVVNTHYFSDLVREYIQNGKYKDLDIETVFETNLLGTAGTLKKNHHLLLDDDVMLVHVDNFSIFDSKAFLKAHELRPTISSMTMMTFTTKNPESCGVVRRSQEGLVTSFFEKIDNPPTNEANAAVYLLGNSLVNEISELPNEFIDFSTEIIPSQLGRIFTYHNDAFHEDIGTPARLFRTQIAAQQLTLPPSLRNGDQKNFEIPGDLPTLLRNVMESNINTWQSFADAETFENLVLYGGTHHKILTLMVRGDSNRIF